MTKTKNQVVVVEAPASEVAPQVEQVEQAEQSAETTKDVPSVPDKKFTFRVVAGKHYVGEKAFRVGDLIETDEDLVAICGKLKFELVRG